MKTQDKRHVEALPHIRQDNYDLHCNICDESLSSTWTLPTAIILKFIELHRHQNITNLEKKV